MEPKEKMTREEIDDFIDEAIDEFEEFLEEMKDQGKEIRTFECPKSGKTLKGEDVPEHLDVWTREKMYDEYGILEKEEVDDAYKRAMRGI